MSIIVAGLWELGWNSPLAESWLWDFPLRDFGVEDWRMTPVSGIKVNQDAFVNLTEYPSTLIMLDSLPEDHARVYVDERGETPLHEFEHPKDVVYIFGKAGESPMRNNKKPGDESIKLVTVHNRGVMWPHQCLVTVLHDRLIKECQLK